MLNIQTEQQYNEIVENYSDMIFRIAYQYLFNKYDAEDIVQEVFIAVWRSEKRFDSVQDLTRYLYRACYNNALVFVRNNQIHDTILNSLAEEESVEDEDMIYALTVKEEIIRQLYCYIEELPSEQRRIILMRIEGHTWEEIAERLEISINTVKTQKTRSYKFLRERLGDSVHSIILCLFL